MVTPREKTNSLLEVISELFNAEDSFFDPPSGVEKVERVTFDAVRIKFVEKVDRDLLYRVASEEGYIVEAGYFAPRVIDKGTIVARVGSQSDPGGESDMFIYLFPPFVEQMSMYRKVVGARDGVLDSESGRIDLERFYECNLRVIRLVEKYRRSRYESLRRKLEL